ncbi:MAG: AAA family ATPase [Deltaproteobacteria bacterium]|nr:AAA family ATPase [Deltaproteobacteria bacterium]
MDRITHVRIRNVRAIEAADLEISRPLTVLIGENGSGKSTILESLELLRKAADSSFMLQFYNLHGGMPSLLRKGAAGMALGVVVEDDAGRLPRLVYEFELARQGAGAVVRTERLLAGAAETGGEPGVALRRVAGKGEMLDGNAGRLVPLPSGSARDESLAIGSFGALPPNEAVARLLAALGGIEVHLAFHTLASWAGQSVQRQTPVRGTTTLFPANRLTLLGHNLGNAWYALKNLDDAHWRHTMELVRLGLGSDIDNVNTVPDAGGGNISLVLKRSDLPDPIPASSLSDGQLAWLAFVALARLKDERSLLAFDEPELHLHPALLGRVVSLLAGLDQTPVVLATHADRVLEMLDDPAGAVRVCSIEGSRAVLSRIEPEALRPWLDRFGDLGQLRASGYLPRVLVPASGETAKGEGGR